MDVSPWDDGDHANVGMLLQRLENRVVGRHVSPIGGDFHEFDPVSTDDVDYATAEVTGVPDDHLLPGRKEVRDTGLHSRGARLLQRDD